MSENGGCYVIYKIGEGNFRVVVVSLAMLTYALAGAALFQSMETPHEESLRQKYIDHLNAFLEYHQDVNETELKELLQAHADAAMNGFLVSSTKRWTYSGALYYVVTLVTTIGFGMTTPGTDAGKIVTIIYGFFGCSLNVLCMNLLLERHIICFTKIMAVTNRIIGKLKSKIVPSVVEMESGIKPTEEYKPPIVKLLSLLLVTLLAITLTMAAAYTKLENWRYLDSIYYCFITYSTIGFGDMVAQQKLGDSNAFYSILNGISIYLGTTFMYSIYNILSILLKDLVVKFSGWITINCYRFYYDPNIDKVAEMGRRTHALAISHRPSVADYHGRKLNIYGASRSPSASLTRQQYENNIASIAQEYRARNHRGSVVSQLSNGDLKVNEMQLNAVSNSKTISSPSEQARTSIHSLGIEHQPVIPHRHLLRLESFKASDNRHLSLARRESDLVLTGRIGRPKSRIQREAGGMNAVRSALEKMTAEASGEVSESDDYL